MNGGTESGLVTVVLAAAAATAAAKSATASLVESTCDFVAGDDDD